MTDPYPKEKQLGRAFRKPKRARLTDKQFAVMAAQKMGPCRVCNARTSMMHSHHVVFRGHGGGDVPDNIVPVCPDCHNALHNRAPAIGRLLWSKLSDAEYAYAIMQGGEDYPERAYGISYERD